MLSSQRAARRSAAPVPLPRSTTDRGRTGRERDGPRLNCVHGAPIERRLVVGAARREPGGFESLHGRLDLRSLYERVASLERTRTGHFEGRSEIKWPGARREQEPLERRDAGVPGRQAGGAFACQGRTSLVLSGIAGERVERAGQRRDVARLDQLGLLAVANHLRHSPDARRDDRQAGCEPSASTMP